MKPYGLRQIVRVRSDDDLDYLAAEMLDGVIINANQLENRPRSTADRMAELQKPVLIDPMLWRFQLPSWWQRDDGTAKRNFASLATRYAEGIEIRMASGPITSAISNDSQWRQLARNVVAYQLGRLQEETGPLAELMASNRTGRSVAAIIAPYLLAQNSSEDRINRILLEASAEAANQPVIGCLALPGARFRVSEELTHAVEELRSAPALGYLVWPEALNEEAFFDEPELMRKLLTVIDFFQTNNKSLWHANGGFAAAALRRRGLTGFCHSPYWVDRGMPARQPTGTPIHSLKTYVSGLHHTVQFDRAISLGRHLPLSRYQEIYCSCHFCRGAAAQGQHPLKLLIQARTVKGPRGSQRLAPTNEALSANTWHYLWSRRSEVLAFASASPHDVLQVERQRAVALGGDGSHLQRLIEQFPAA